MTKPSAPRHVQIKHRYNGSVLFECDVPDDVASGMEMRHAMESAVAGNVRLSYANFDGATFDGANFYGATFDGATFDGATFDGATFYGANFDGANFDGANFDGANFDGTNFDGGIKPASSLESIEALDKVGAIIIDNEERLNMGLWHQSNEWKDRTCAEETLCETTHCLAGWLQVCSTNPEVRSLEPQLAGIIAAPVAAKMFFKDSNTVLDWLKGRKYVGEIEAVEKRRAERAAAKATGDQA